MYVLAVAWAQFVAYVGTVGGDSGDLSVDV
jgi:hypothetical protein